MKLSTCALVLSLAGSLFACGGSDYDIEYDCEQTRACLISQGADPGGSQEQCVKNTQALFDVQPKERQKAIEEIFRACKDKTGCDYSSCVNPS